MAVSVSFWSKFGPNGALGAEANCPYPCLESSRWWRGVTLSKGKGLIVRLPHSEPCRESSRHSPSVTATHDLRERSTFQRPAKTDPASRVTLVF